jgi:hypothetical protein
MPFGQAAVESVVCLVSTRCPAVELGILPTIFVFCGFNLLSFLLSA